MPGRLAHLEGTPQSTLEGEVRNEPNRTTINRNQHLVGPNENRTRIESRTGTSNSLDRPDLSIEEAVSADGVFTIGASRNREKSEGPRISRHARPFPSVRVHSYAFLAALLISVIIFRVALLQLVKFSAHSDYSYIPLIPLISAFLILSRRGSIFENVESSPWVGGCILTGGMLLWLAKGHLWIDSTTHLELSALAVVSTWSGLFVLWYGRHASHMALLPLSVLLFIVPPPESAVRVVVQFLQQGSAVVSYELFRLVGVPALRQGTAISLPQLTIIVGPECSGIHSSICLLILTLMVENLCLRSGWNKVLLVLTIVPLVVVKNAIRIVTLSILAVYVDPGFLTGPLHHQGGILFFLIGLAVVVGIVMVMQWSERKAEVPSSTEDESLVEVKDAKV
jgi:exosortase